VANLWTEFAAQHSEALATKGTNRKTLDFHGGCKFGKGKHLRFAERRIRNAEVRGSIRSALPLFHDLQPRRWLFRPTDQNLTNFSGIARRPATGTVAEIQCKEINL
jgi:hypothetical protein